MTGAAVLETEVYGPQRLPAFVDGLTKMVPTDIYDTLELAAHANGGVGAGWHESYEFFCEYVGEDDPDPVGGPGYEIREVGEWRPLDIFGLARHAGIPDGWNRGLITTAENDAAVRAINWSRWAPENARVSFDEFVAEVGWIRFGG